MWKGVEGMGKGRKREKGEVEGNRRERKERIRAKRKKL